MKIRTRIFLLQGIALLALLVVMAVAVVNLRNAIIDQRRSELTAGVQAAYSIASHYRDLANRGVMTPGDAQHAARDAIRASRFGGADGREDYFYVWTLDEVGVGHPIHPEWEGRNMTGKILDNDGNDLLRILINALSASPDGRAYVTSFFPRPGYNGVQPKFQYVMRLDGWNWMIGSGVYVDDLDHQLWVAMAWQLLWFVLVSAVVAVAGLLGARSILRKIGGEPDLAIEVIGEVANGNLSATLPAAPDGSILEHISRMVVALRRLVGNLHTVASHIEGMSNELDHGTSDLAQRTESAAANLQTTASSMEEITSTIQQTADSAETARHLAASAAETATQGGTLMHEVVDTMNEIHDSSHKIDEITGVIDGIAFQTNILALNAAVEAARAGEQGRGFAVVASEVRNLSKRVAEAAREIKGLINESASKVQTGAKLVANAGTTMTKIVESVEQVDRLVGEIRTATKEQSQGMEQISSVVNHLDETTQQNAALVKDSMADMVDLREQLHKLKEAIAVFRVEHGAAAVLPAASPDGAPPLLDAPGRDAASGKF